MLHILAVHSYAVEKTIRDDCAGAGDSEAGRRAGDSGH